MCLRYLLFKTPNYVDELWLFIAETDDDLRECFVTGV